MHIVGTAGHVDHGKSSLVMALTGTNPDRWTEEQERGMTLDLGFAHLSLGDGLEAGLVDVPGHERFLHNMLAGAAGMDLLLLVVAANEGVMPQTIEHVQIVGYLNVRRTFVVLTKSDLMSPEELELVRQEIRERLRGTIAEGAPLFAVSSVTHRGFDELRAAIAGALRSLAPRDPNLPVYLPIDRVFTLPGLGTIVTGTLMQGTIAVGDAFSLEPSGLPARVRSLHVFGQTRSRADAGTRVALNLPGIDRHGIARGETLVGREFEARSTFAVSFEPLEAAVPLLKRRMPVRAYVGSAEILGTLVFDETPRERGAVNARLLLRKAAVAFRGVRFVVRRVSPKTLLGGGRILGVDLREEQTVTDPVEAAVAGVLRERGLEALSVDAIALAANLRTEIAQHAVDQLAERDEVLKVQRPIAYVDGAAARELLTTTLAQMERTQRAQPWIMGSTSLALARSIGAQEALVMRVLAAYAEQGKLSHRAGYYATLDHHPSLTSEQQALFERLVPLQPSAPFVPCTFAAVLDGVKRSRVPGSSVALETLVARGALVKVADDLYRGSQIAQIRARVEEFLQRNERMTASQFRDLLGTSRKHAVPLLEWLDAHGVTLRSGDYRTLRKRNAST